MGGCGSRLTHEACSAYDGDPRPRRHVVALDVVLQLVGVRDGGSNGASALKPLFPDEARA